MLCCHTNCFQSVRDSDDMSCGNHKRLKFEKKEVETFQLYSEIHPTESQLQYCAWEDCIELAVKTLEHCEQHSILSAVDTESGTQMFMANKNRVSGTKSCYVYVCGWRKPNGLFCKRKIYRNLSTHRDNIHCRGHTDVQKQSQ